MKNIFCFMVIISQIFYNVKSNAQITLEHTVDSTLYGYLFYPVKISSNETKFVFLDTVANSFSLYNLDFSPFITNVSVPHSLNNANNYYYYVMYVTRTLFDCDSSNIEYMFSAQNDPGHPLWIMRTDGTILFYADSTRGPYCLGCPGGTSLLKPILPTENGTKLVLMKDEFTIGRKILIYSVCGTSPEGLIDNPDDQIKYIEIYPNPSSNILNYKIFLPDNLNRYEFTIINDESKICVKKTVSSTESNGTIDMHNYRNGIYFFYLSTKDKILQSGKFIITK